MNTPNFVNRTLFQGDNIDYLRLLNSESVDLIATDPPFNKGRDFYVDNKRIDGSSPSAMKESKGVGFTDRWSWKDDIHGKWLEELKEMNQDTDLANVIECIRDTHSDDMGAYICYMAPRLLSMKRVLKPTGSIFLHCDMTASHYLKMLMDIIFGKDNFRNEIIWCYASPGKPKGWFPRKHDNILFYSKTDTATFNPNAVLVPHKRIDKKLKKFGHAGELAKEVSKEELEKGKMPFDWWSDIAEAYKVHSENTKYPTQKPLKLYKRIIEAASNEGDMVLDPFCGCATTLLAAEELNRQWIGMDLWDEVYDVMEDRIKKSGHLEGSDGIRRFLIPKGTITRITDPEQIENPYKGKPASPYQKVLKQYKVEKYPWQDLSLKQMVKELAENEQKSEIENHAICAGCGRDIEIAWVHLDHIQPKSDGGPNDISNRIIMCPKCNHIKKDSKTIPALWKHNIKTKWMKDEERAKYVREAVKTCCARVRVAMEGKA